MLFAAVAFLFISVWGFQQRGDAIKKAKEADTSRDEAEFRKKEADSLRIIAEGRATVADIEKMLAQINADSAERQRAYALFQSKISEQEKLIAFQQAEEAAKRSAVFQKEKEESEKTAEKAIEQQSVTEKEKNLEFKKRMLSIAQIMAGKVNEVEDKNLKGLLAYQAYLFNSDYEGQLDQPDIYTALYKALSGINGENYNELRGHEGGVRSLAFQPGTSVFYSSGIDGKILRWDLSGNTKSYRTLINNNFINRSLSISPNGRWLACGTTTTGIQLFNLNAGDNTPQILEGHQGWVEALAFTPDSKGLYSASTDRTIIYYDLIEGTKSVFANLPKKVRCLAVSPSGRFVFGGTDDGKLIRWNMDTKEETVIFSSANNTIFALAINSTGSRIAFVDGKGSLRLVDARTNSILRVVAAHSVRILDVKFSPDDRQIATSSMDWTLKIWDANNFTNLPVVINKHEAFVLSIAFSPDGKYIVSSSAVNEKKPNNPLVCVWPAHASFMAEQMCGKISRNLTQREWENYVSYDIPYQKTCPNK